MQETALDSIEFTVYSQFSDCKRGVLDLESLDQNAYPSNPFPPTDVSNFPLHLNKRAISSSGLIALQLNAFPAPFTLITENPGQGDVAPFESEVKKFSTENFKKIFSSFSNLKIFGVYIFHSLIKCVKKN